MEQLKRWRQTHGKSLVEAGELIGVTGVQWHRYESGTRRVADNRVLEIERITGISRHELRPDIFGPTPTAGEVAA